MTLDNGGNKSCHFSECMVSRTSGCTTTMESCQVDLKAIYCKVMLMSLNVLPETWGDVDLITKSLKYVVRLNFIHCVLCASKPPGS